MRLKPITLGDAAVQLDVSRSTLGVWVHRYKGRRLGRAGRSVLYDFWDLAAIEVCLRTGRPVPSTPAAREALRSPALAA